MLVLWMSLAQTHLSAGDILFDAFLSPNRVVRDNTFGAVLDASFAAGLTGAAITFQLLAVAQSTGSLLRSSTWLVRVLVLTAEVRAIHSTHVTGRVHA